MLFLFSLSAVSQSIQHVTLGLFLWGLDHVLNEKKRHGEKCGWGKCQVETKYRKAFTFTVEVTVSNAWAHYACLHPPEPSSPLGHSLKEEAGDNTRCSTWSRHFCSHRCWIQIQGITTGLRTLTDVLWFLTSTERNVEGTVEQPLKEKSQKLIRMHWVATRCVWIHCSWHFCRPLPSIFNSRWYETCSDFHYLQN